MTRTSIAFAESSDVGIVHVLRRRDGSTKIRAVRVDEADTVLDVQTAIDRLHPLDLQRLHMLAYHYCEDTRRIRLGPDQQGTSLRIAASKQHYGIRHWWVCPVCKSRRRHLYFFRDVWDLGRRESSSALACRPCLGLVYASQARHRCADHDLQLARKGNEEARRRMAVRMRKAEGRSNAQGDTVLTVEPPRAWWSS